MARDPNDGFFKQVEFNRDPSAAERQRVTEESLAESAIKAMLTTAGYKPNLGWAGLAAQCQRETGSHKLTFAWFHETFPRFPVRMDAARVKFVYSTNLRDLFDGFRKMPVFKAYTSAFDHADLPDMTSYFALVFRDVRRMMVLHNYPRRDDIVPTDDISSIDESHEDQGTLVSHRYKTVVYTLETLDRFASSVGNFWAQDD